MTTALLLLAPTLLIGIQIGWWAARMLQKPQRQLSSLALDEDDRRDMFASEALAGLLSNESYTDVIEEHVADRAFSFADAMMTVEAQREATT